MNKPTNRENLYITTILLIGCALRFFQLGHDSLWLDEAGVAIAALKPLLADTLLAVQQHAMAMPLDYLVVKLMGQISTNEFWLRVPSAVWGTLTLWVCYRLFLHFTSQRVALLTTLFMASFPLLVRYSQELRFYASMIFFYSLTTLLLVNAVTSNRKRDWLWVVCASAIGAYFHIYVVLAYLNGLAFLLARNKDHKTFLRNSIGLLLSVLFTGLLVLPGYLVFGGSQTFSYPLLQFYSSIFEVIALAFGWAPSRYVNFMVGGYLFGLCMFLFEVIGLFSCIKSKKWGDLYFLASAVLQAILVLSGDWLKGYWVFYRQFIFLVPLSLYFSAQGAVQLWIWLSRTVVEFGPGYKVRLLSAGCVLVLLTANIWALVEYFSWQKSCSRQITAALLQEWHPGDKVRVYPPGDQVIYYYYLKLVYNRPDIVSSLEPSTLSDVETLQSTGNDRFLIAGIARNQEPPAAVLTSGFKPMLHFDIVNWGRQYLYERTGP